MRKLLAVATAALVVALGACSNADEDPTEDPDGAPTTTAPEDEGLTPVEPPPAPPAGEAGSGELPAPAPPAVP